MAENADFSSLLEEIKENMPELYQEMEAYAQRTGKSLAELSKDEAFVSRYSARYSERKDAVTALDNAVDEEIAGAGSEEDGAVAYVDGSYHIGTKERPLLRKRWLPFPILSAGKSFTLPYRKSKPPVSTKPTIC